VSHTASLRSFPAVPQFQPVIRFEVIATSVDRKLLVRALLPQNHERHVDRDFGDPRRKTGSTFEPIEMDKNFKKGLLESILCIFSGSGNSICGRQNSRGVTVSEFNEGIGVTVFCRQNQAFVTHLV
jgi:hypothetical protein